MSDDGAGAAGRAAAARVVDRVVHDGRSLDAALAEIAGELAAGSRPALMALVYGTLRWHLHHRHLLARLLARPLRPRDHLLEALLSVGLRQLRDRSQPSYAVVSAAVAAARSLGRADAAGLVNAVLRRYLREREDLEQALRSCDEARYSLPDWLIRSIRADWPDHWRGVLESFQAHPPLWLRVDLSRTTAGETLEELRAAGLEASPLEGTPSALRLAAPAPVAELPGFDQGLISVQDAGAQLAAPLLLGTERPPAGLRVLDACAAPGGKTAHVAELGDGQLDLWALDIADARLDRLRANLKRLGRGAQVEVLQGDAARPADWWDGRPFDRILLDAPCSATGVIRRHPDIPFLRRPSDIPAFQARQRELLESLWPLLRPGGRLLYVTCSVLHAENAGVVAGFLDSHADARQLSIGDDLPSFPGLRAANLGCQLLPDGPTDGFYYALMMRVPDPVPPVVRTGETRPARRRPGNLTA